MVPARRSIDPRPAASSIKPTSRATFGGSWERHRAPGRLPRTSDQRGSYKTPACTVAKLARMTTAAPTVPDATSAFHLRPSLDGRRRHRTARVAPVRGTRRRDLAGPVQRHPRASRALQLHRGLHPRRATPGHHRRLAAAPRLRPVPVGCPQPRRERCSLRARTSPPSPPSLRTAPSTAS